MARSTVANVFGCRGGSRVGRSGLFARFQLRTHDGFYVCATKAKFAANTNAAQDSVTSPLPDRSAADTKDCCDIRGSQERKKWFMEKSH
jgi:hypothetical protein